MSPIFLTYEYEQVSIFDQRTMIRPSTEFETVAHAHSIVNPDHSTTLLAKKAYGVRALHTLRTFEAKIFILCFT